MQTSPTSPIVFGPRAFRPFISTVAFLSLIVILAVLMFVPMFVALFQNGFDVAALQHMAIGMWGIEVQAVAEIVIVIYLFLILPRLADTTLAGLGFRSPAAQNISTALLGTVAMFAVTFIVGTALATLLHVKTNEAAIQVFLQLHSAGAKFAFALFACVLAPLTEELVFRVFLFNAMRTWWSFWPAAIVSSVIFGLVHTQGGGPAMVAALAIPLACAGLVLCSVYARTGNAWSSMITHGCFNLLSLILIMVAPKLAQ